MIGLSIATKHNPAPRKPLILSTLGAVAMVTEGQSLLGGLVCEFYGTSRKWGQQHRVNVTSSLPKQSPDYISAYPAVPMLDWCLKRGMLGQTDVYLFRNNVVNNTEHITNQKILAESHASTADDETEVLAEKTWAGISVWF